MNLKFNSIDWDACELRLVQEKTNIPVSLPLDTTTGNAKTRPVFEQYKATKYSRKFLAEHEADLELYRAAQAEMRSLLGGAKLPKMDVLKEEGRKLTAKKKQLYGEYQKARRDMQELVTIKANIDTLMGYTEPGRKQEKER